MKPTTSEYIKVKDSNIHGKGIYAAKNIKKGTRIIEYVGEKLTKKQGDKRADELLELSEKDPSKGGVYVFEVNKKYDIDGSVSWNTSRLINHSCNPNCESIDEDEHIWIEALIDIKKGDELTYNYNYDLEDYQDHPCKCGSKNCIGFIVDEKHWKKIKNKQKK